ncbi:MAG: TetR/AcrR family transcriptional regulator [Myxococcota bacterium]
MTAKRHRLSVEERRAQLLELALELFSNRPYDEISIDEIAQAAGISKGLLYHYFQGKRGFYLAAVDRAAQQLLAETDVEPATQSEPDLDAVRTSIQRYLTFVEERSASYSFLMRGAMAQDAEVQAVVERTRRAILDRMLRRVGSGPPMLRTALRGYIGLVEAASLDWLEHRDVSKEALTDLLVKACVHTVSLALS